MNVEFSEGDRAVLRRHGRREYPAALQFSAGIGVVPKERRLFITVVYLTVTTGPEMLLVCFYAVRYIRTATLSSGVL